MKNILLILFYSICTLTSNSQDSTIMLNKFQVFSNQPGEILKTEAKEIGSVGSWVFTKLKTTAVDARKEAYAIQIDYKSYSFYGHMINREALNLDLDELDSVIKALTYFIKEGNTQKPASDLDYSYITSTDFKVFCSYLKDAESWQFGMGKVYYDLRSDVPKLLISFNKKRTTDWLICLRGLRVWNSNIYL